MATGAQVTAAGGQIES